MTIKIILVIVFGLMFLLVVTGEAYDAGYGHGRRDERMDRMKEKEGDNDVMSEVRKDSKVQ